MKTLAAATLVLLVSACGSTKTAVSASQAAPPATAADIVRDVEDAGNALKKAMTSLEIVVGGRSDTGKAVAAYLADLETLNGRVQKVRDLSADLTRRRDAYLKDWLERSSSIQSASMKETAEKRRTELMSEFMTLGSKGSAVRRAFSPMHDVLQDCGRFLASDTTAGGAKSLTPEFENLQSMEPELQQAVNEYKDQLRKIRDMLGGAK